MSYQVNEVWSIDWADMQQVATEKPGSRYVFVAVDTLNWFLWVGGVRSKTSRACSDAQKNLFATNMNRKAPIACSSKSCSEKT